MLAAQGIAAGDIDVAVAGGMESMSNCAVPPAAASARGCGWATARLVDSMIHDGLWCAFDDMPHGNDRRARGRRVSRHARGAGRATPWKAIGSARSRDAAGWFAEEICRCTIPQKKGAPHRHRSRRIHSRRHERRGVRALKPAFKPDGTVTAGNAPGVNDGAAALVVMGAERGRALA